MTYRRLAPLALAAALLLGGACSHDSDGQAALTSRTASRSDGSSTTTAGEPGTSTTEPAGTGDGGSTERGAAPENQNLDVEQRNPYGVTLKVSGLRFEKGDIFVDAELINGSTYDATITTWDSGEQLRLVDDAGQTYNYVEAKGDQETIAMDAGESVKGTFAFRGPLTGEPDHLSLVMGVYDDDIDGFDLADKSKANPWSPGFVVPFELTWA
ncbi:MAG TPA: hypothetical protein VKB57_15045 [Acidimicrobiales bacterium]|nr:hypothetical protein [Acidimicrobiales bacterium]